MKTCTNCGRERTYIRRGLCWTCRQGAQPLVDDGIVDEVAVERAMRGDPVALTPTERMETVRRLAKRGLSDGEIGARVGATKRSVERWRKKLGVVTRWVA